uniref:serine/arginine repetitive matrix protein 2 n=1 Tax=Scatophagus argus TaxID=75038 RepID=UPI001ED8214A|nr:serine/arginine repetitive matrix protein 2 [Scatophagus argus]
MDSWTLQGDSYSFLRSAPRTFSLCHRDGTPNHVEIFDIINVPSQRSAISETTCLCDIFGDDCESSSLSSSPAVGAFIPSQREADGKAAASPLVDELNDSSGSYHSVRGSSEGEECFEDSRERFYSPLLQSESSERQQLEGQSSGNTEVSQDNSPNPEPKRKSPVSQLGTANPSSEVHNTGERTPSAGHYSPHTLSPEGIASSLSSSSAEKRYSPSQPNPRQVHSEAEPRRITPTFKGKHDTPNPSPEPKNCVSSSSSESVNTKSLPEFRIAQVSPEPRSSYFNQHSSPSPEQASKDFSLDCTESVLESRAVLSSPLLYSSTTELSSQSRETLISPELKNRPYSPDTQASSPFPEVERRISLPDLFSRGSTPDIEDSTHPPEQISDLYTAERDTRRTPESQSTRLSAESVSIVSTSGPRYTPPSPVISTGTSPDLVDHSVSPELSHTAPSPGLLSAASSDKAGTRTPSLRYISSPFETETKVSSPVVSLSLSPSPEVTSNNSSTEHRYTAPSPEIRITASSPEVDRRDWSCEASTSPLLESHFDSASSRSLNSSPHITGISYSVVQPEDRDTPPFPELSRLSTPEPDRTFVPLDARSPTPSRDNIQSSIAESTPQDSLHIGFTSSVLQPEIIQTRQPRYHTLSPCPKHHTFSPEPRYSTPSSDKYQSPSPQHRSKESSPVAPSPEQRYHQYLPTNFSTEENLQYSQPTPPLRNTPEVEADSSSADITETRNTTSLKNGSVSHSFELERAGKSTEAESKSKSPVVAVPSPVCTSPFFSEEKVDSSLKQQRTEREATPKGANLQGNSSVTSISEEKQAIGPTLFQNQDTHNNPPIEIRSTSPNPLVSKDRSLSISLVHRAPFKSPVQKLENTQLQDTSYYQTPESSSSLKTGCTREHVRKQQSRFTEDMAHHVNRRRTPSPPLTRFTPVHIIAPEKPYRDWQNQIYSPSQVVASSPSGNLKKAARNRESPNVSPVDNNSQAHWVRPEMQLEMEKEMQLEENREVGRGRQREMGREKKREEQFPERGKGWQGDTSYREEQVELSFNARNRKGPASRRAASTSRETRQGLPTAHSYSESLLSTRQLQQQQSLLRLASQQDTKGGGSGRRLLPPAPQNKNSAPGRVAINRSCRSSSSSMGSELDEADNEVKWFTDLAFHSLSSPEVDYLDMYNSSHRSSTNISQPSTQESPAGVSAAWLAYADLRGSAPKLDNDELSGQQASAHYSAGLDPSRCYEMGSFECIDVAVEREDSRKERKGVPKRQIQLKRKDNAEEKQGESSENSSPGVPMMVESPSLESHSRETFVRQYSTPAVMQECYTSEGSPEPSQQNINKSKLWKSASLDETCTKTKMATCLIKSVLSKKIQSADKQPDEHPGEEVSPACEEKSPPTESGVAPLRESPKPDVLNLSSSLQSDYSLSSEGLPLRGDPSTNHHETKPPKSFGVRCNNRPSSSSSNRSVSFSPTVSEEADSQSRNVSSLRSEMKSELKMPFDRTQLRTVVQQAEDSKTWDGRKSSDSVNATAGNVGAPSATGPSTMQAGVTNRDQECENTEDHKQLYEGDMGTCASKTQEITFKAVEKKKTSLNVCLTPEAEIKPEASSPHMSEREREDRVETGIDEKMEEGNGHNQVKVPIHKVRDVRRLVKNTYNLSFKATSAVMTSSQNEERTEDFIEESREEIKEERREEVAAQEEREAFQEIRTEERKEEFRVEKKDEQNGEMRDTKILSLSPTLKSNENTLSHSQPMQIECKAVCWREDKNKMSCITKDSENLGEKPQAPPKSVNANTQNYTTGDTIDRQYQHDLNMAEETQENLTKMHKVLENEDKPVVIRTDRKPPLLGSLPKLPSKEREVSTAVVLIRDGSSKTKISASAAQEEVPTSLQAPVASPSPSPGPTTPGNTHGSSGHSVSMLLKEKGYQADIGAVVGDNQNAAGGKGVSHKHVNCLEIPLQTTTPSDNGRIESNRERTFSSSSPTSGPSALSDNTDTFTRTREDEGVSMKPAVKDAAKRKCASPLRNMLEQTPLSIKQKEQGDFEAVKRLDPTFPPRSPAIRRFRPQPIEVKSLSKEIQKQEIPTHSAGKSRPQTIEVKSIAKNSQKPAVPPKPICKFKPADLGAIPHEAQRQSATTSTVKIQGEERPQTIVVSSPTIYRKISNESTSNCTRKLAVSAVSSLKPPSCKTATATPNFSVSSQSTAPSETEASHDKSQPQKPGASDQSCSHTQRPSNLNTVSTTATDRGLTSAPGPVSDTKSNQILGPASAGINQSCPPAVMDPASQPQYPRMTYPHEHITSNNTTQLPAVSTMQFLGNAHQPCRRSFSIEHSQRPDELHFYASDDPPSYDERESFSPLMLPDLTSRRSNRYQPSSLPPPCSCTAGCPSHPGLTAPHHQCSPCNLTPPAPPHSPGQALPYPVAQPPLRPHQCRSDPQQMIYQPGSPKSSPLTQSQPPAIYQPLHQPPPCPPHPSLMQACPADRQLQPPQHTDSRRPPVHRSPQQQPPGMTGAPYNDPSHSHSPGIPPLDPQYLCGPQSLGPSYGSEYGGDSSSLYSESGYGQTPRRVLLDPDTGKYFYIEMPVQPLRKMLFDPETGQYVEVLIPQQAMSHAGLFPSSAAPYPSLHNPNMYAPAPQYMPYAAPPPPPAHPQAQPQPPRYPEASATATMHTSGPGVSYRNPSGRPTKPEPQNHPPLDQSYLDSMYYVPTGMNASPNPTPPEYYHKHPPNLPPTGGKRS